MDSTENMNTTEQEPVLMQTKAEVVARVQAIAQSEDAGDKQELDLLKQLFYKYHNTEQQEARQAYLEAGGDPEQYKPEADPDEPLFKAAMQTIRERRAAVLAQIERQKEENLKRKLAILDRIRELTTTPEEANQAFEEYKQLQAEWKEIKNVPAERATELWKNYQLYTEQFYDLVKLNSEMREYDFRKNLETKTHLCEQAEALAQVEDVISAFNQLQGLHQEWKETGPVAREVREEIWTRFKEASTVVNKRHQDHFEALKAREEENLAQKTALCEQVEGIQTDALKTFAEWEEKTQEIIQVQAQWKTIGYAPQKMNQKVFDRFRAACDAFFEKKNAYFHAVKDELNENLTRKRALVEKAEALQDSTEWRSTTDAFITLQKQWKEIGAVPRKHSDALWKRFTAACDHFFEEKNKATADERNEQKANLEQKYQIIEQLKALAETPADDTIDRVKELQAQWNEVGHVPFRDKDKVYKQYREICDKLYGDMKQHRAANRLNNFKNSLKTREQEGGGNTLQNDRNRMMRAYEALRSEIQTYENNLGFLSASSKKGNTLVAEMAKRVEKQKEELALLEQKIKAIDAELATKA